MESLENILNQTQVELERFKECSLEYLNSKENDFDFSSLEINKNDFTQFFSEYLDQFIGFYGFLNNKSDITIEKDDKQLLNDQLNYLKNLDKKQINDLVKNYLALTKIKENQFEEKVNSNINYFNAHKFYTNLNLVIGHFYNKYFQNDLETIKKSA